MKTLYKSGKIYNTKARSFADGEIAVENGIIVAADSPDKVVDLGGAYVMPGLIDVHTHGRAGFAGDDTALGKYADFIVLGSDRASIDSVYVRGNLIK